MSFNLKHLDVTGIEEASSFSDYKVLESGVYLATIKGAYIKESAGGAVGINFILNLSNPEFGVKDYEFKQTIYITNRNKEPFFVKDGKKQRLPGYTLANNIAKLATNGLELNQLDQVSRTISEYNPETKSEVPAVHDFLNQLDNGRVQLGIVKVVANKRALNGMGEYVQTDEKREYNEISAAFQEKTLQTVYEIVQNKTPTAVVKWKEKNENSTVNKYTPVATVTENPYTSNLNGKSVTDQVNSLFGNPNSPTPF